MSYDIYMGDLNRNVTYNLSRFFHHFIVYETNNEKTTGLHALYGMTGKDALPVLNNAFLSVQKYLRIRGENDLRREYNPENGWGNITDAINLLGLLTVQCALNPNEKIEVM